MGYRPSGALLWSTHPAAPPDVESFTLDQLSPGISYDIRLGLYYDGESELQYGVVYDYETCETGYEGLDCTIGEWLFQNRFKKVHHHSISKKIVSSFI